jgi:hypothetical protein
MVFLLLVFVLSAIALTVLFWVVTLFFQGYFYTEGTEGIAWQAPTAGVIMAVFFTLWCWLDVAGTGGALDVPYDTLFRFSPTVDKFTDPVKELWVERKGEKDLVHYQLTKKFVARNQVESRYVATKTGRPYAAQGVDAIIIQEGGQKTRLLPTEAPEGSFYRDFVDDQGWVMKEYDNGPTGLLETFRWGRFILNIFLNVFHLVLWFVCLWLVLRFAWTHALGLAAVLWLVMTLSVLPMLLEQSGVVARAAAGAEKR